MFGMFGGGLEWNLLVFAILPNNRVWQYLLALFRYNVGFAPEA